MDLKHILNPISRPSDPPITQNRREAETPPNSSLTNDPAAIGYIHPRFFLSPRRLDPETSSVSTNSSTKRRRTNRGRFDVDTPKAAAMGRSFSEIEAASDISSDDDEEIVVKHGVANLSLSGIFRLNLIHVDEYGTLKPAARVEALKSGTQGTWYVARIVEFASFPAKYLDGYDSEGSPDQEYPMVCVHYEGFII